MHSIKRKTWVFGVSGKHLNKNSSMIESRTGTKKRESISSGDVDSCLLTAFLED